MTIRRGAGIAFVLAACAGAPAILIAQAVAPSNPRMAPGVRDALREEGRAVVFVCWKSDGSPRASGTYRDSIRRTGAAVEERLLAGEGASLRYRFEWVPAIVAEIASDAVLDALLEMPEVTSVDLDQPGRGALLESGPYIRAPEAHALGVSGANTIAAVLDSGIDTDHPSFDGAILHTWHSLDQGADQGEGGAEDSHGHGTNVAGIIASRGGPAPAGIAPGAKLIALKVLDDDNTGWISDWAAGIDHVIHLKVDDGMRIDAINMSLESLRIYSGDCDGTQSAFFQACIAARDAGIAVFAASGNNAALDSMTIPACYSAVISVGSTFDTAPDRISGFTNRDDELDLLAPGQPISSTGIGGGTSTYTGTSQATPHATAVACLLREAAPELSPLAIRDILVRSGRPFLDASTSLTFPILDARAALEAVLTPRLEHFHCESEAAQVAVTWDPADGVDHFEVAVARDEETIYTGSVGGGESRFDGRFDVEGDYSVCVQAVNSGGLRGLTECCAVALGPETLFRRGDCDATGALDLTDVVTLLGSLFLGSGDPQCPAACDSDGDATLNITDAVYLLNYLFRGGPSPAEPFSSCGAEPDGSALRCSAGACS